MHWSCWKKNLAGIDERVQVDGDPTENLDLADLKNVLFGIGEGLIELKGTVGPLHIPVRFFTWILCGLHVKCICIERWVTKRCELMVHAWQKPVPPLWSG